MSPAIGGITAGRPLVSVVTATYNRSNVLRHAIDSVRNQSLTDWEHIIVGDACTDDTADVVAGYDDRRLRFVNLVRNVGEQSGPNNVGVAMARGRYVAFLNHDDLFLPDHLQVGIESLQASGADGVIAVAAVLAATPPDGLDRHEWAVSLQGFGRRGRYDPATTLAPASSWIMARDALDRAGPWRSALECVIEPSQDWLFRVWSRGLDLRCVPHVSVVLVQSGSRRGSYIAAASPEHEYLSKRIAEPDFRVRLLAHAIEEPPPSTRTAALGRTASRVVRRALARAGANPRTIDFRIRRMRPGSYLNQLRQRRGLDRMAPLEATLADLRRAALREGRSLTPGATVSFAAGEEGTRHRLAGWAHPEPWGTWTDRGVATLAFRFAPPPAADLELVCFGHAYVTAAHPLQRVHVFALGRELCTWRFVHGDPDAPMRVRIPAEAVAADLLDLELRLPDCVSPASLGEWADERLLGFALRSLRFEPAADPP